MSDSDADAPAKLNSVMHHIFRYCVISLLFLIFKFKKKEISTTAFVFLILLWATSHPAVFDFGGEKQKYKVI